MKQLPIPPQTEEKGEAKKSICVQKRQDEELISNENKQIYFSTKSAYFTYFATDEDIQ